MVIATSGVTEAPPMRKDEKDALSQCQCPEMGGCRGETKRNQPAMPRGGKKRASITLEAEDSKQPYKYLGKRGNGLLVPKVNERRW